MIGHSYYLVTCAQYVQMVMRSVVFVCVCVRPFTHLPVSIFMKIVYATHLHCVCHQICLLDLLTIPNISIHVIPLSPGLLEVLLW